MGLPLFLAFLAGVLFMGLQLFLLYFLGLLKQPTHLDALVPRFEALLATHKADTEARVVKMTGEFNTALSQLQAQVSDAPVRENKGVMLDERGLQQVYSEQVNQIPSDHLPGID